MAGQRQVRILCWLVEKVCVRGNRRYLRHDYSIVRCEECREQVSAQLDGEDDPALRAAVDAHLASCTSCRRWQEEAARVTRMARMTVASATPDLTETVMQRAPRVRGAWWKSALRVVLALLAVGQLAIGLAHINGAAQLGNHGSGSGVTATHFTHEFAAFTIALGIGFGWIAWRTARAPGLVPTLAAFVLVLTVLEIADLARGYVDASRLLSHTLVQAGLAVVLLLSSRRLGGDGFFPHLRRSAPDAAHGAPIPPDERSNRGRHGRGWLRPSARRDAA